ncbi:hypothetical protein FV395_23330 [Salmonella enterica]|nr:hypothetical protein [Salmonella enterica]
MANVMPWELNYSGSAPTESNASTSNNMGNIRSTQGGFKSYDTPDQGALDQMRLIQSYNDDHGLNTIAGIANRWAPPTENNTPQYTAAIGQISGLDTRTPLDLSDPVVMGKLAHAQAVMEKGAGKVPLTEQQYIDLAQQRNGGNSQAMPWELDYSGSGTAQPAQQQPKMIGNGQAQDKESMSYALSHPGEAFSELGHQLANPETWSNTAKRTGLAIMGTRENADLINSPLGYLSPFHDSDVTPEDAQHVGQLQAVGREGLKVGAYTAAALATEGLAAPVLSEIGLAPALTTSVASNVAGSVASQAVGGEGISAKQVLSDVATGEAIRGVGNIIKAGSAARRATMTAGREADAARESRIGELVDSHQNISANAPTLHGLTPEEALSNPSIVDSFRKPGETDAIPQDLQTTLKGMYGNEQGQAMIDAATTGTKPTAAAAEWQPALDARWNTPIRAQDTTAATRRLENEYTALEKKRPEVSLQRLDELNQKYQAGGIGGMTIANTPVIGTALNPSMRLSDLSASTLARLGIGKGEAGALAVGEGAENSLFGLGQVTRKYNQRALDQEARNTVSNAGTMAARKGEGSRIAHGDLDAMQYQHDQLTDQLAPTINDYYTTLDRQTELLNKLNGNLSNADHLSTMQELNNVTATLKTLEPQAINAQGVLDQSANALAAQTQKAGEAVKISNAYSKSAKTGEGYRSTREMTNYEAGKGLEAEGLTAGGKTKGYDQEAYAQQSTPRELQEAREETATIADKQRKAKAKPESKLVSWAHFITRGATFVPHLVAVGYSRSHATAIMNDLARTGGKNLTGDELRNVIGSLGDKAVIKALANSKEPKQASKRPAGWGGKR